MELSDTRPRRLPNSRMIQNFHLVWLDKDIDVENNEDCRNSITKLRQIVNTINTFIDLDESIDFITDVNDQQTFVIVSHELSKIIIPVVEDISQVTCVCIFRGDKVQQEKWIQQRSKVKGIYADIESILEPLKQFVQDCDRNSISISFVKTTNEASTQSLDTLDQSFMYTQILKEILLTINFEQSHIKDFLTYCRAELIENTSPLKNLDKIAEEYDDHDPIWWYTCPSFLYSMVNRALRVMDVELIIKMGFFIRDLHQHIAKLHVDQLSDRNNSESFTVYRGQGLSQTVLDQLMKTQDGLLSFNNFLSTSIDKVVSLLFAESNQGNAGMIGVLFVININRSIPSSPFANVRDVSYFQGEEEILFSMHSVFRIGQVQQSDENTGVWQVDLTLTSDNDPQLHDLTKIMNQETSGSTGWHRLVRLMVKLGHFGKAEELCNILLNQTNDQEDGKSHLYHIVGALYYNMEEHSKALSYHEQALEMLQKAVPANHSDLATSHNNVGEVYRNMGEYSKALSYYEKALEIKQKSLPANHPDFAGSYNNIGSMYHNMGQYSKALSYHEQALEMLQKAVPANHSDLATSHNNVGEVYRNMGEYPKALAYFEKALGMQQKILPANHPTLATSYNNIGGVYYNIGEYPKALSYFEKALGIQQKILPANHPSLATSYNNIGGMLYHEGREYSKALSYHEQALEIFEKTLPENHPTLATSYSNIGLFCSNMKKYSKALSYYEKALEIRQKILPANHPDFATSYNNIGGVYHEKKDYSKALSYYEKALEIRQQSLPANHPRLATSYSNIGGVYDNMGEYSKALSYFEKALKICQCSLPFDHPDLENIRKYIDFTKKKL